MRNELGGVPLDVLEDLWLVHWGSEAVTYRTVREEGGNWMFILNRLIAKHRMVSTGVGASSDIWQDGWKYTLINN